MEKTEVANTQGPVCLKQFVCSCEVLVAINIEFHNV